MHPALICSTDNMSLHDMLKHLKRYTSQGNWTMLASKCSDSFTILGLWVLGIAVSHINESSCKPMSPEHYFNDKSAILLHPGTR